MCFFGNARDYLNIQLPDGLTALRPWADDAKALTDVLVKSKFFRGGIVGRLLASRRFFLSAAKKEGPDTVASRGQVPRSSPLPPVMAEGGIRGAFFSAETAEYLDLRSRNLT
ncbi:MAG: hypothetical protein WAR76_07455 [Xanthobacteraceae bacterium]